MNITEVRIRMVKKDESKLKAVASVTVDDCLVVHDIKVIQGNKDGSYFIAMPSKKTPDGEYKDIVHPLNTETRDKLSGIVLAEFEKELAKQPPAAAGTQLSDHSGQPAHGEEPPLPVESESEAVR